MLKVIRKAERPSIFLKKFNKCFLSLVEKYERYMDLLKLQHEAVKNEDLDKIERYKSLEEIFNKEIITFEKTYSALEEDIKRNNLLGSERERNHELLKTLREELISRSELNQALLNKKLFKIEKILKGRIKTKYTIRSFSPEISPEILDIEA